ncbi:MAG: cupin domain-containing protein [Pseudomonadota bacterium]|nr:cupin domain-containing protein [Pseudomonadota bacterium]
MKELIAALTALALVPAAPAFAQSAAEPAQSLTRAGTQKAVPGSEQYFTGAVLVEPLAPVNAHINASAAYVTFQPGARSAWHTHPKGQHIIVTHGAGRTQEWGKPVQDIKPGDVVWCPPGVKHWHGAAPSTPMTHLVITGSDEQNRNVTWMEKVSDAQYDGK